MRWLAALAVGLTLCTLAAPSAVRAQNAPGAPGNVSVTAAANSLTISWAAPTETGGSPITAYDVRHILSTATERADADWTLKDDAWTSDALQYVITGLRDSTGYDVQVRAVNANGDGPWSTPWTSGTTTDHADTTAEATSLAPGSSADGRIAPGGDADVFSIVVAAETDVWLYTTGDLDTTGTVTDSSDTELAANDDGMLPPNPRSFSMRAVLPVGTHYVTVTAAEATATGLYTLHARTVTDPGSTVATATTVTSGSLTPGRLTAGGTHYFKLVLAGATDLWALAIGSTNTSGELLNASQNSVASSTDSQLRGNEDSFSLRASVAAGTYYVKVTGANAQETGPYILSVRSVSGPGDSMATAAPLTLELPRAGRIDTAGNEDYFSITLDSTTHLRLEAHAHGSTLRLTPTLFDAQGGELPLYYLNDTGWPQVDDMQLSLWALERLPAGTYSIRISADAGQTGAYLLHPTVDVEAAAQEETCKALAPSSSINDPLYGCQWHLNNTNQFGDGAGSDINVEQAWQTTMGEGINVLVVDVGLDYLHPDLRGYEYESDDPNDDSFGHYNPDGSIRHPDGIHGTNVAGVIAARDNDIGTRGVAPRATVYGYNVTTPGLQVFLIASQRVAHAAGYMADVTAVSSNSWRFGGGGGYQPRKPAWEAAVEAGALSGYGGKGVVYVWLSGNGHPASNANLESILSLYVTTVVCAVDYNDVRSGYSEIGSNVWVCAPSRDKEATLPGIATTALGNAYNLNFTGTSAATPIVSGVAALVRGANTDLTWRDVKLILAGSARKNDASNTGWLTGALKYGSTTDERYSFNHEYGFGVVDAGAAVTLATGWSLLPTFREISVSTDPDLAIPDPPEGGTAAPASSTVTLDSHVGFVEYIDVELTFSHQYWRDLRIELVSPDAKVSTLTPPLEAVENRSAFTHRVQNRTYRLGSARHLGENAAGTWTLRVTDEQNGMTGTIHSWKLTAYGHGYNPDAPGITSATTGASALTVAWSAPDDNGSSDITSYDARSIRSDATAAEKAVDANWAEHTGIWTSGDLEYRVTGLADGVAYDLQVRAVNTPGASLWSETLGGMTAVVPQAPTISQVTSRDGGLALTWTAPAEDGGAAVDSYDARSIRSDATAAEKAVDANWAPHTGIWTSDPGGDLRGNVAGLDNGVGYDVQVRAVNAVGSGAWSTTATGAPAAVNRNPEFPEAETGAREVREDIAVGAFVGAAVAATDLDVGDTLTYSILNGHSLFEIVETTGRLRIKAALDYEAATSHTFTVQVSDMLDSSDDADTMIDDTIEVTVTVTDANEAPTIESGPTTKSVPENSTAVATYTADDVDATDTHTWSVENDDDGGKFAIGTSSGVLTFRSPPDFETPDQTGVTANEYRVTVKVTDAGGMSATRSVTVTLTNVNEPPTITTTRTAISVAENQTAVLTYTASDVDASDTMSWSVESAGDGGKFQIGTSSAVLTFRSPPDFETPDQTGVTANEYRVTVTVTDGGNLSVSKSLAVTVTNVNEAPDIDSGSSAFSVDENTETTTVIQTYEASDVDALTTFTWSLEGADRLDFRITRNAAGDGELRFRVSPNYEMPADSDPDNVYDLTVRVVDNGSPQEDDTIPVTITVDDVNERPTITTTRTAISVAENQTAVLTYAASDVDASDTKSWSVEDADDGGKFQIGTSNGVLTFTNAPDFETKADADGDNVYDVTVTVTDSGSLSASKSLAVTVTNVNEPPHIDAGSDAFSVDENTETTMVVQTYEASDVDAGTTLTWTLEGEDAGDFTITRNAGGHGELKFAAVPDYERPVDNDDVDGDEPDNVYDLTVRATDNGLPQAHDTFDVTITVNDVNETPVISGRAAISFEEINFASLDADLSAVDFIVGIFTFEDDDGDDVSWDVSGDDAAHFDTNEDGGVFFDIRPDYENPVDEGSNNTYNIVLEADDGSGASNAVGTRALTITVTNFDESPAITGGSATPGFAEIEWDADPNSVDLAVDTYTARDEEMEAITWSLGGDDRSDFRIDSNSGALSFRSNPDFEAPAGSGDPADNSYEIIVMATDATAAPNTPRNVTEYPVTVTVGNIDETPEVSGPADDPDFPETPYDSSVTPDVVATFSARDEEDQTITWSLGGDDAGDFTITKNGDGDGVVTFTNPPNFEMAADEGSLNTYVFTVEATDTGSPSNTGVWDYAVTVTDINETPELTGTITTAVTYDENETIDVASYSARDEEGGVTWSLTGTDRGDFFVDSGGVVTFVATPSFEDPDDSNDDNVYTFTVVATDVESKTNRLTASVGVTVTVADVEEQGVVSVDNLNPAVGDTILFTLTDPDGGINTSIMVGGLSWDIEQRAPGGVWAHHSSPSLRDLPSIPYSAREDDAGLELRAVATSYTDRRGSGKTAASEATAAVTADPIPNAPPRFIGGGPPTDIAEGGDARDVGDPVRASDRENDTVTFGIQDGPLSASFEINAASGQVRLTQALDFETAARSVQLLGITMHDGRDADGNVEADPVVDRVAIRRITVTDVEEPGVVTLPAEEPESGTPLRATLEDGDGSISTTMWGWARSEDGSSGWINISGATSSSYTPGADDEDFYLRASVTYTDNRGDGKTAEAITAVRVPSENRRPAFPSTEDGRRSLPENTGARVDIGAPIAAEDPEDDQLVYTLSGPDAAAFAVDENSGQLRTSEALDFETKPTHTFTIEVHDGGDGAGNPSTTVDDSQSVTVTIENVEEPGMVALTTTTATIQARVPVTATLDDDDGPTGVSWQWSRSPNGSSGWVNIASATSADYTPTLADVRSYIRATASYTDGQGPNKTAHGVSPRAVGEPPPVNSAPAFPSTEDGQRDVPEDAAASAAIGAPVAATDFDMDDLSYSLGGTDAASFTIDADTGQLRLASNVQLDFEGKGSYRVTVSVSDGADQNDDPDSVIDATINVTITVTNANEAPVVTGEAAASFAENDSSAVASYSAADPERDTVAWSVAGTDGASFVMTDRGALHFRTPPDFEGGSTSFQVTVTATDGGGLSGSLDVTVSVTDVEEAGTVTITPPRGWVSPQTQFSAVLSDGDGSTSSSTWQWARSSNRSNWADIAGATSSSYSTVAGDEGQYLQATASYSDRRGSNKQAAAVLAVQVGADRPMTNTQPSYAVTTDTRAVGQGTAAGRSIGAPVAANDADQGDVLSYSLSGADAASFEIDQATGQLRTKAVLDPRVQASYTVTVSVHDGFDAGYNAATAPDATIEVTITVTEVRTPIIIIGGGGGGGGGVIGPPPGPTPSDEDFEWTVTRDIEALDSGHDSATGAWSDGVTLWIAQNGDGADDAVYAYDLESGERVEEREFELAERSHAPRGVWSDRATVWVSDSGQDMLFAHDLASGEPVPDSDLALHPDNDDPRGIWSDGEVMWVLDDRDGALFGYDLDSGELLAEYALDAANDIPHGIWSDRDTVWVSDDRAKRLFAYRLPVPAEPAGDEASEENREPEQLERVRDEEFEDLRGVSNNSPRGIWSDGEVMYVVDESDGKVYSYNMPDAIDVRLASLTLSDIDFGEFSASETEYEGVVADGVTETTVAAGSLQPTATVVIKPADSDEATAGQQVALEGIEEITVTVTSADGSRTKVYRVVLAEAGPSASCLRGAISTGFSLLVYEGGSIADLEACAQSRQISALYTLHEGGYVSYVLGAPDLVNQAFRELFPDGAPALSPLLVQSEGPPAADPAGAVEVTEPWTECLRGGVSTGFSLLVYEGGSVEELAACAGSLGVTALYALYEGAYVSYIPGAPDLVNGAFSELFPGGIPAATPLIATSD